MGDFVFPFVKKMRIRNLVAREFLAEFLGTFVLILIGDAAFAQALIGRKEGNPVDVFAIVWAWGVAVMLGILTCGGITGGHINPAVTVAFASIGKLPWWKVGHYMLAQHTGAFAASGVLFLIYKDGLDMFDPNRTIEGPTSTAMIWATYPREGISLMTCFLDQTVATGLLMFTALATIDEKNLNLPKWSHPLYLGFMISAMAMCFGFNCMAPLNPARDFATRLFTACVGYGLETFSYKQYWWIGIVATHLGAVLGAWAYYLGIEIHWPENKTSEEMHELTRALNSADQKA